MPTKLRSEANDIADWLDDIGEMFITAGRVIRHTQPQVPAAARLVRALLDAPNTGVPSGLRWRRVVRALSDITGIGDARLLRELKRRTVSRPAAKVVQFPTNQKKGP